MQKPSAGSYRNAHRPDAMLQTLRVQ